MLDTIVVAPLDLNLVSLTGFEAFLDANLDKEFPGRNVDDCPAAQYLRQVFNNNTIRVGLTRAYQKMDVIGERTETIFEFVHPTTFWIKDFVRLYDEKHDRASAKLTGWDARRTLEELLAWQLNKNSAGEQSSTSDSNSLKGGNEKQEATGENVALDLQG